MSNDLGALFSAQEQKRRWMAERENASARYELAKINEACASILSAHEPVASLGIDRDALRVLISYIHHGDQGRLHRETADYLKGLGP